MRYMCASRRVYMISVVSDTFYGSFSINLDGGDVCKSLMIGLV
jgi:hypothetical protein